MPCARDLQVVHNGEVDQPSASEAATRAMMTFFDPFGLLGGMGSTSSEGSQAPSTVPARRTPQAGSEACERQRTGTALAPIPYGSPTVAPGASHAPIPLLTAQYHPPVAGGPGAGTWGYITIALPVPPSVGDGLMRGR